MNSVSIAQEYARAVRRSRRDSVCPFEFLRSHQLKIILRLTQELFRTVSAAALHRRHTNYEFCVNCTGIRAGGPTLETRLSLPIRIPSESPIENYSQTDAGTVSHRQRGCFASKTYKL